MQENVIIMVFIVENQIHLTWTDIVLVFLFCVNMLGFLTMGERDCLTAFVLWFRDNFSVNTKITSWGRALQRSGSAELCVLA